MKNTFIGSADRSGARICASCAAAANMSTIFAPEGLLYAVILRSSVAHGRIRLDRRLARAEDVPACMR